MPYIAGITTATPPNILEQQDAKQLASALFGSQAEHLLQIGRAHV